MTSMITVRFGGALLVSTLVIGASALLRTPDAYAEQAHAVMTLPQSGCKACEVCRADLSGHSCATSGSGQPHVCLNHGCFDEGCDIHESCLQSNLERHGGVKGVYLAVSRSGGSKLKDYVRTLGTSAVVNESRRALQIQCDGTVIANIPLSVQQVDALTDD